MHFLILDLQFKLWCLELEPRTSSKVYASKSSVALRLGFSTYYN